MVAKVLAAACLVVSSVTAADTVNVNFGLAYPLSLQKTAESVVHTDISVINGVTGWSSGLQVAGIVSTANHDVAGVQASGIVSMTKNNLAGMQASGIVNATKGTVSGFQSAGIINIVSGEFSGYQAAGIMNLSRKKSQGVQIAGILNISSGDVYGGQIGMINTAKTVNGIQVGLINISDYNYGVPIGLVNIAKNGEQQAIAYASSFSGVNAGAKFIVNNWHSIITLGGVDMDEELDDAGSISTFFGYHIPLSSSYLEIDIGQMAMAAIDSIDADDPDSRLLAALRLTAGWNVTKYLSIFAGAGAGVQVRGQDEESAEFKPLYYGGLTFF